MSETWTLFPPLPALNPIMHSYWEYPKQWKISTHNVNVWALIYHLVLNCIFFEKNFLQIKNVTYSLLVCIVKSKGALVHKKFQILCQKSLGKSRYSVLMYERYCLYSQEYTVQCHLCLIEGVSFPLEARKGLLA